MRAKQRRWGEDLTYAEEHRAAFDELYGRISHRFHVADRDWTEACCGCRAPLMLIEEHRDVGQDLLDKGTTITRNLARRSGIEAWQMAWRNGRPDSVQREIEQLNRRLRELERTYPITGIKARQLSGGPDFRPVRRMIELTPDQWWQWIALRHRQHHAFCRSARRVDDVVDVIWDRYNAALHENPLHNGQLWHGSQDILKGVA